MNWQFVWFCGNCVVVWAKFLLEPLEKQKVMKKAENVCRLAGILQKRNRAFLLKIPLEKILQNSS